jgi:hypothetical protein
MWMIEQERHVESLTHPYGWIMTRDRNHEINEACRAAGVEPLDDDDSQVGTIGPRSVPAEIEARLRAGEGVAFRLIDEGDLDDCGDEDRRPGCAAVDHPDYGVVFEGRLIDPDEMWEFGPLNDFGAYVAIGIQYRAESDGEWRDL